MSTSTDNQQLKLSMGNIITIIILVLSLAGTWFAYGDAAIDADALSKQNKRNIDAIQHKFRDYEWEHKVLTKELETQRAYLRAIALHLDVEVILPDGTLVSGNTE